MLGVNRCPTNSFRESFGIFPHLELATLDNKSQRAIVPAEEFCDAYGVDLRCAEGDLY